jgi:hypothetical protein
LEPAVSSRPSDRSFRDDVVVVLHDVIDEDRHRGLAVEPGVGTSPIVGVNPDRERPEPLVIRSEQPAYVGVELRQLRAEHEGSQSVNNVSGNDS